jgi:hypothetical protein
LQRFLDEAEKDKERYNREMEAYQKTEAYKLFKSQKEKKMRGELYYMLKMNRCTVDFYTSL